MRSVRDYMQVSRYTYIFYKKIVRYTLQIGFQHRKQRSDPDMVLTLVVPLVPPSTELYFCLIVDDFPPLFLNDPVMIL